MASTNIAEDSTGVGVLGMLQNGSLSGNDITLRTAPAQARHAYLIERREEAEFCGERVEKGPHKPKAVISDHELSGEEIEELERAHSTKVISARVRKASDHDLNHLLQVLRRQSGE